MKKQVKSNLIFFFKLDGYTMQESEKYHRKDSLRPKKILPPW